MHLLYLDDSGDDGRSSASSSHFVLGGLAISDSEWAPLVARIDTLVAKHLGAAAAKTELHGSDMLSGRGFYRAMTATARETLFQEVLEEVGRAESRLALFFVAIHKDSLPVTRSVRVVATLQLCQRFNSYLTRIGSFGTRTHERGILVCDEHASKGQIKSLVSVIHSGGVPKQLRDNLVETAFFVESHESRMVQVADLLCHTLYRFLTAADDRFFHLIERKIDRDAKPGTSKVVHYGLRYIAAAPDTGLARQLPFKYLTVAPKTGLPVGTFLQVDELEKELTQHGMWLQAVVLAAELGVYAYDAYMLELARRRGIPLLTLDAKLGAAARRAGLTLMEGGPAASRNASRSGPPGGPGADPAAGWLDVPAPAGDGKPVAAGRPRRRQRIAPRGTRGAGTRGARAVG